MRRILLVLTVAFVMAAMMAVAASQVLADAEPNRHNCAGAETSAAVPIDTEGSGFRNVGQYIRTVADSQGDFQKDYNEGVANCGANRR